jgi:hypothetical protein
MTTQEASNQETISNKEAQLAEVEKNKTQPEEKNEQTNQPKFSQEIAQDLEKIIADLKKNNTTASNQEEDLKASKINKEDGPETAEKAR